MIARKRVGLLILLACTLTAQQPLARRFTAAEWKNAEKRLSPALIPAYQDQLSIDPQQSFLVAGPQGSVALIPVQYMAQRDLAGMPAANGSECGVFTLRSDGTARFTEIYTIADISFAHCEKTDAVAFVDRSAGPPLAVLHVLGSIFLSIGGMQDESFIRILHWDSAAGKYVIDKTIEDRLSKMHDAPNTVTSTRRLLETWKDVQ